MGWHHIISISAYDHLSFVVTLCALFTIGEWKKVLTLVTAFTIGHSVTLALSTLNYLPIPSRLVEILIPITILFTVVRNLLHKESTKHQAVFDKRIIGYYITALLFGFIHGMGFASSFRLMVGSTSGILTQLFAFNCGLELGQMAIVLCMLLLLYLSSKYLHIKQREWNLFVSGCGFSVAIIILLTNLI